MTSVSTTIKSKRKDSLKVVLKLITKITRKIHISLKLFPEFFFCLIAIAMGKLIAIKRQNIIQLVTSSVDWLGCVRCKILYRTTIFLQNVCSTWLSLIIWSSSTRYLWTIPPLFKTKDYLQGDNVQGKSYICYLQSMILCKCNIWFSLNLCIIVQVEFKCIQYVHIQLLCPRGISYAALPTNSGLGSGDPVGNPKTSRSAGLPDVLLTLTHHCPSVVLPAFGPSWLTFCQSWP